MICAGDLNVAHQEIDLYDTKGKEKVPGFTPEERHNFGVLLSDYKYVDTFRDLRPTEQKYSFWSARAKLRPENKGWRLDYFVIDADHMGMVEDSDIHNKVMGSDHCPISIKLNLQKDTAKPKKETKAKKVEATVPEEKKEAPKRSKTVESKPKAAKEE